MTKAQKLKQCNWILAILLPIVLASSIQLEATSSNGVLPVILHIAVAIPFMVLIIWHIYLHFKWNKWLSKFSKLKNATRILWWLYLITFLSGIATLIHWLIENQHSPLGGIHGKIGFLMIAFAIGHIIKRLKFFNR
ncbi:MAG: hypothetical protein K2K27_06485 [Muribaculaceae bacterium]|nr:hypothetical protein [Muribaculaceae bacterium]MDE6643730.1 hypothetical protein [Muribaculaceae bacterium]